MKCNLAFLGPPTFKRSKYGLAIENRFQLEEEKGLRQGENFLPSIASRDNELSHSHLTGNCSMMIGKPSYEGNRKVL